MTAKYLSTGALVTCLLAACARDHTDVHPAAISQPTAIRVNQPAVVPLTTTNLAARNTHTLFLRNCAHCHGADAHGDDGPDLHHLELTDQWIANRINRGKAGQMTAFAGKLQPEEIAALVAYVQGLK